MEKDKRANRFSPELRGRAVRMVFEQQRDYESQSAAIKAIAPNESDPISLDTELA